MKPAWAPRLGAVPEPEGVRFRVFAPDPRRIELLLEAPGGETVHPLAREPDGCFAGFVPGLRPGALYRYRLDGEGPFADPASRFQPRGVHGPSQVVDPRFAWSDAGWTGLRPADLVIYELHIGAFTTEGSFAAARERLPWLRDLGVTALELMPLADFPGERNWGYDGVALFAPARCYGRPEELRALVDAAHAAGLGVLLDVVYNHLGPDGAPHARFCRRFAEKRRRTPWGDAIGLDGPDAAGVRELLIENALHWLHEYHLDGLRLDATHHYADEPGEPFLARLSRACRERARPDVRPLLIAEDERNLRRVLEPLESGGFGIDAVWADDLHYSLRRAATGSSHGHCRDFTGESDEIARALRQGWLYEGQASAYYGRPRGSQANGLPFSRFVVCLQNHDQVGNRPQGERLHHRLAPELWRALSALVLLAPETPLLFMGEEWSASAPFLYFTDHEDGLGLRVSQGRERDLRRSGALREAADRPLPDPQSEETFRKSVLDWQEAVREPHASQARLVRSLLALRREHPLLSERAREDFGAQAAGPDGLALWYARAGKGAFVVLVRLRGAGSVEAPAGVLPADAPLHVALTTEDAAFAGDPLPIEAEPAPRPRAAFARAGAVVLVGRPLRAR
ncbi:MAG: malto-oligosyltrehalose trehalohydrolase [Vicinamibacteria bacterium]